MHDAESGGSFGIQLHSALIFPFRPGGKGYSHGAHPGGIRRAVQIRRPRR